MRNKLKRRKTVKTTSSKGKDGAQTIVVFSESSSDDEASQKTPSTTNREKIKKLCKRGVQIAPIFLSALQSRKSKRGSDGSFVRPGWDTQKSAFSPQNNVKSSPSASHLTLTERSAASTHRKHLSASALTNYLEEIQTLNPAFSVQAVFSCLQQKAGDQDSLQKEKWTNSAALPKRLQAADADSCFEEVLWTDKYSPQRSSEVIGNAAAVNKLLSWLKKWKRRADCDDGRETEERRQEGNDSWDCGDFQGEAGAEHRGEVSLSNTVLITGPSGVGKTASVYACAQELGFKVFEVNSSSQRSGRQVLSQLKEATQSHLVEISGTDSLKPAFFSSNSCALKPEALPGKILRPKNVPSAVKTRPARRSSSSGRKAKAKPDSLTLRHYFKMKDKADQFYFSSTSAAVKPDDEESGNPSPDGDQAGRRRRRTATSLILFEEVDVIFEEDVGFLAAIEAFMATTRRPVVLTTSDPFFKERFPCRLEEILFKPPSAVTASSYLQLVCLAEDARLDSDDVRSLCTLARGDIRRCLLQLQLWVLGGEGPASHSEAAEGNCSDSLLSQSRTCCSADMLGLPSVTPKHLLNVLKRESWSETDTEKLFKTLSESWRRGVPLLYANLELLMSLRAETSRLDRTVDSHLRLKQKNLNVSPKVSTADGESAGSLSRLRRKKFKAREEDSQSSSSLTLSWTPLRAKAGRVEGDGLDALAHLFDLMSYLDATLPGAEPPAPGPCTPDSFAWTGAALKDGLLDEMREDGGSSQSRLQRFLDIKAAAEGFGCRVCFQGVCEARIRAQTHTEEQEDPRGDGLMGRKRSVSPKSQRLGLTFPPLCAPRVSRRRFRLSRMLLSSDAFSLQGNKHSVCVNVMPVLRFICRTLRAQQGKGELARCGNYLSGLGLSDSTMKLLTEDFT